MHFEKSRKTNKLIFYLNNRKPITASVETIEQKTGRKVCTTVTISRVGIKLLVEIEKYYLEGYEGIDISNEKFEFNTLEQTLYFIHLRTGLVFSDFSR